MGQKEIWHNLSLDEVVRKLDTDLIQGLTNKESQRRRKEYGRNEIVRERRFSKLKIMLNQLKSPLMLILMVAGLVTWFLEQGTDALVIFAAIVINSGFGFWEENKVNNILEKLKKSLKGKATVIREGRKRVISKEKVVPGDLLFFKSGDKITADARVAEAKHLLLNQSVLTGEWVPVGKLETIVDEDKALGDRDNMVYKGSLVEAGEGVAIVVATGNATETGQIATMIEATEKQKSPLQKQVASLGKLTAFFFLAVCLVLFVGGVLRGESAFMMFEASVAVAVGGIPEALPAVVTITLAIGMERLLRKRGLVRRLNSVETLGSASVICFDKTKTLTKGEMRISEVAGADKERILTIAALANEAFVQNSEAPFRQWELKGAATDRALLEAGFKEGILGPELAQTMKEKAKLRFDAKRKFQLSLRKTEDGELRLLATGATEVLIKRAKNGEGWQEQMEALTKKGLRVIAAAERKVEPEELEGKELEELARDLEIAGLLAFEDPLRPGIARTFKVAKRAGLTSMIITGDHRETARAVLREVGIAVKDKEIMEGTELDKLSEKELVKKVGAIKIFARTEPRHKIRIVKAWQSKHQVVAMVGDGVNDGPAIKRADIGLAHGSGTEVAKEAADLILLDDSFQVIIKAIGEGRQILDNLRKSVSYMLADSLTSVIVVGGAKILLGWPLPILPVQLLWNNIVEDTFPNLAFAFEPKEKGIMRRKPNGMKPDGKAADGEKSSFFTGEMKTLILITGLIDEFLILGMFWLLWKHWGYDLAHARTLVFGAVCVDTAFVVFSYKDLGRNLWQINPFSNKWLNLAALLVIGAFSAAVYVPFLQRILETRPLSLLDWGIIVVICVMSVVSIEITKWAFVGRKRKS